METKVFIFASVSEHDEPPTSPRIKRRESLEEWTVLEKHLKELNSQTM